MTLSLAKILHRQNREEGWKPSLGFILSVIIVLLLSLFGYIVQMNGATAKGYEIRALETQASSLKSQNERLHAQVTELRSMERIVEQVKMLGLVESDQVEYLTPMVKEVAVR